MTNYAERRVLALLFANPQPIDLKAEDFKYSWHRLIFTALQNGNDVTAMDLPEDVKVYLLDLDEDWTPKNLEAFARIVKAAADQRRFASSMDKLK